MKLSSKLILGSQSPRRKELLSNAGFEFETRSVAFEEVFPDDLPAQEVAAYLAKGKNQAYRQVVSNEIVLTADTVVIQDNRILGKPKNILEAQEMLHSLSGKVHQVVTGVCISSPTKSETFSNSTEVKVKNLEEEEINHYISKYEPFDKAGAYGIQEWFGLIAVEWIKGSFYNVVGLPVDQVYATLKNDFRL